MENAVTEKIIGILIIAVLFLLLWQSACVADEAPRPHDVPEDVQ
jgi:hypothetical protein